MPMFSEEHLIEYQRQQADVIHQKEKEREEAQSKITRLERELKALLELNDKRRRLIMVEEMALSDFENRHGLIQVTRERSEKDVFKDRP